MATQGRMRTLRRILAATLCLAACAPFVLHAGMSGDLRATWRAKFEAEAVRAAPDDAKARLGRALFFDTLMSTNNTSCSSCHLPDRAFGPPVSRSVDADGPRPPSIVDVVALDTFGWDGHFKTLESVAFAPITSPKRMNMPEGEAVRRVGSDLRYKELVTAAYGDPAASRQRIEDALAAYERTIVHAAAPFDRYLAGDDSAIDGAAKRGFAVFAGKGRCSQCHEGPSFTDGGFHDVGTGSGNDRGRGKLFPASPGLQYAFKTPHLRDLGSRAPYMHDASAATLEDVVELYDKGGVDRPSRDVDVRPLHLTAEEKSDLVAFLKALDSKR